MLAALTVDGTPADLPDDPPETVTLELGIDAATHRCRACGSELHETTHGYEDEFGGTLCPDFEPPDDIDSGEAPHDPERVPVSWCNSAAVHTDEAEDSVTVSISVGDVRGAFTLTIRRVPDDADNHLAGHLIMHTPYATQPSPHMELTPLHDGTYVVGSYSPNAS
ncbi:hypothetical protein L3Q67_02170 [Saccharothrix sp. AJ9571]|nr:hypothetical protein L3Q67_02170 [Saccharothrix sp. AJ9571]